MKLDAEEGSASPWDIHLSHFLEPFLDGVSHQLVTIKHAPLHHQVGQMNRNSSANTKRVRQVSSRPPRFTPNHHRISPQSTYQQNRVSFIFLDLPLFPLFLSLVKKEVGVLWKQAARGNLRRLIHTDKRGCRLRALLHVHPSRRTLV